MMKVYAEGGSAGRSRSTGGNQRQGVGTRIVNAARNVARRIVGGNRRGRG